MERNGVIFHGTIMRNWMQVPTRNHAIATATNNGRETLDDTARSDFHICTPDLPRYSGNDRLVAAMYLWWSGRLLDIPDIFILTNRKIVDCVSIGWKDQRRSNYLNDDQFYEQTPFLSHSFGQKVLEEYWLVKPSAVLSRF